MGEVALHMGPDAGQEGEVSGLVPLAGQAGEDPENAEFALKPHHRRGRRYAGLGSTSEVGKAPGHGGPEVCVSIAARIP